MNQNINVDLIPKFAVYGNLYFSQYDVGREAIINLVNGSTEYEIPSGATVTLAATKPSGLGFTQNCTFEGNQITVVCTAEMTDEAGHFPCELRISNGSLLLGTANFTFNVERSPHPEGTTDGTADSVISQITVAFETAMQHIENSGGLTLSIKNAILNCFSHVAWIDEHGQEYYDDLESAFSEVTGISLNSNSLLFNSLGSTQQLTASLIPSSSTATVVWTSSDESVATVSSSGLVTSVGYGNCTITATANEVSASCSVSIEEITVVSLSAVLNADGHVFYVGDPVDDIKPYLTVTASLSDSSTVTVPSGSYTLSGSLSIEGDNTITVSYSGESTTVTVTAVTLVLLSIDAVYTQSGTVYDNQTLDSLKADLVVTASWDDSSTTTLSANDYSLSGTLTTGTSTITVSYGGKTDTFDVTVTHATVQYTITNTLTQCTNSNNASVINELTAYSGTLTANSGYVIATVTVMMGNTDITSTAYDSSTGAISIASVTGNIVITAEAIEDVGWISGVPYTLEKITGSTLGTSGIGTRSDYSRTNLLPCEGATYIVVESNVGMSSYFYNDDFSKNKSQGITASTNYKIPVTYMEYTQYGLTVKTSTWPSSLTVTPYKLDDLTENTVWVANKLYNLLYPTVVRDGSYSIGQYYETDYFNCVASTTLTIGPLANSDANATVYFYNSSKEQMSTSSLGYVALGSTKDITVPEGAYYFKVSAKFKRDYGTFVSLV